MLNLKRGECNLPYIITASSLIVENMQKPIIFYWGWSHSTFLLFQSTFESCLLMSCLFGQVFIFFYVYLFIYFGRCGLMQEVEKIHQMDLCARVDGRCWPIIMRVCRRKSHHNNRLCFLLRLDNSKSLQAYYPQTRWKRVPSSRTS